MVAFILYKRWKCPDCTEVYDTDIVTERPVCVHKRVVWNDGKPEVEATVVFMQLLEERYL